MDRLTALAGLRRQTIWPGAAAVSGGGDSIALMHLLAHWAKAHKLPPPIVLSVDHGLRPGSAKEAKQVARWAKVLGLKSQILTARGIAPDADIEAQARQQRFSLIGGWMAKNRIATLYVGHTQDDQAETFLLRLARGSGLDGLSAMRPLAAYPVSGFAGLAVARPMLGMPRAPLRDWLRQRKQDWLEDPMNLQPRFARTRIRALAGALAAAGLTPGRIADAADHLARAREALDLVTEAVLARAAKPVDGAVLIDPLALAAAPREVGLRALASLLMGLSGQDYRPRFDALERLFERVTGGRLGGGATLGGCALAPAPRRLQAFGPQTLVLERESSRNVR
jgi:tRNA(Ile)-lysidine synthase